MKWRCLQMLYLWAPCFQKRSCKALRVCFTESSLLACSTSFLPKEESPQNSGVGSTAPVLLKNIDEAIRSLSVVLSCGTIQRMCVGGMCGRYALHHVYYWRGFTFGDIRSIRQTAKLNSSTNFPAIRYAHTHCISYQGFHTGFFDGGGRT